MFNDRLAYQKYIKISFNPSWLIVLVLISFVHFTLSGCYSLREVPADNNSSVKIYKVETTEGEVIDFRDTALGYAVFSHDEIVSFRSDGEALTISKSNIRRIYTSSFDTGKTVLLVVGISAAAAGLLAALFAIALNGRGFGG